MELEHIAAILDRLWRPLEEVEGRVFFVDLGRPAGPVKDAYAQSDINRRFIIADFLARWLPPARATTDFPPELILAVARTFATFTRGRLGEAFPERRFEVEVIGDDGVDDEPLEVAVTFFEP
jgi:hypothetical protein